MKKISLLLALSAIAGAANAGVVYTQTSTASLITSTATLPTVLDDISFPVGTTAVRQQLSAMTFGLGVAPGTTAQTGAVFFDFYSTVNAASTGAVESNYLGGFGGTLTITANTATTTAYRAFTFSSLATLTTPIYFTGDNIGVVETLTDSTGAYYSSVLTPLMSLGTPTVGSSVLGVYRDLNSDGDFQANEFVASQGNLYLSMTTIAAPVPEPSAFAALGLGALAVLRRRNRKA